MTRQLVLDACSLIDFEKGRLLPFLPKLPYQLVVPLPVRADEILTLTSCDWHHLDDGGLETFDLPARAVKVTMDLKSKHPKLSANDCFCLSVAQSRERTVLITGDQGLRSVALQHSQKVHGTLWCVDQLLMHKACEVELLRKALFSWRDDASVFLPGEKINSLLNSLW